ncbi:MAG: hypothetical protein ACRC1H_17865 [Caldilineaceae bacterium]
MAGALLWCLLLAMLPLPVRAQAAQAVLIPDETAAALTVGDVATLLLEVTHPADTVAILPTLGPAWGDVEVRAATAPEVTVNEDGGLTTRQTLSVALFAPGTVATLPLAVQVTNRSGTTYEVIAPPVTLTVQSVLTEPEPPLRDLKPQAVIARSIWLPVAGGLALLAALSGAGWYLWRRGALGRLGARTPLERALADLDSLAAAGLVQQGRYKELSLGLSQTVRRHLEREYGLVVEERTTRELRAVLRRTPLPAPAARRLLDLLAECDLIKFSEVTPSVAGAAALIDEARVVVRAISAGREEAPGQSAAVVPSGSRA